MRSLANLARAAQIDWRSVPSSSTRNSAHALVWSGRGGSKLVNWSPARLRDGDEGPHDLL